MISITDNRHEETEALSQRRSAKTLFRKISHILQEYTYVGVSFLIKLSDVSCVNRYERMFLKKRKTIRS